METFLSYPFVLPCHTPCVGILKEGRMRTASIRQVLERRDDAYRELRGCISDGRIGGRPECIRIPSPVVREDRDSR